MEGVVLDIINDRSMVRVDSRCLDMVVVAVGLHGFKVPRNVSHISSI